MAVIFAFSATPGGDLPSFGLVDMLVKKGGHMAEYFVLALACLRGFDTQDRPSRSLWLAFGLAVAYALTDELHQSFTPGRHPALTDVAIDSLGAALAVGLAAWKWDRLRGWVSSRVNS
jgi:VanZ family protein